MKGKINPNPKISVSVSCMVQQGQGSTLRLVGLQFQLGIRQDSPFQHSFEMTSFMQWPSSFLGSPYANEKCQQYVPENDANVLHTLRKSLKSTRCQLLPLEQVNTRGRGGGSLRCGQWPFEESYQCFVGNSIPCSGKLSSGTNFRIFFRHAG